MPTWAAFHVAGRLATSLGRNIAPRSTSAEIAASGQRKTFMEYGLRACVATANENKVRDGGRGRSLLGGRCGSHLESGAHSSPAFARGLVRPRSRVTLRVWRFHQSRHSLAGPSPSP